MKYSLRSLMIGVTLFCVLLGARIEYLRRHAIFHEESRADAKATIDVVMEGEPVPVAVERLRIHAYL